jgi:hypothetical protein
MIIAELSRHDSGALVGKMIILVLVVAFALYVMSKWDGD